MVEYIYAIGPDGGTGEEDRVRMLKMTVEMGKALNMNIDNAPNGNGALSMWIRAEAETTIWVDFCGKFEEVGITGEWARIAMRGTIDKEKPIRIFGKREGDVIYIHKAQLEESHVVTDWTHADGEFGNGTVIIDENGIRMTGGIVSITAGTVFEVMSNGVIRIETNESEGSFINLDSDMPDMGTPGGIAAKTGAFSSGLTLKNVPVATMENLANCSFVVSIDEPQNVHNVIWVRPNSEKTAHYTAYTGGSRSRGIGFGFTNPITFSLTAAGTTALSASLMYIYRIEIELYNTSSQTISNKILTMTLKKGGNQIYKTVEGIVIRPFRTGEKVAFEIESDFNFAENTDPITCEFSMPEKVGGLYINMQQMLDLSITDKYNTESASLCNIYYLP